MKWSFKREAEWIIWLSLIPAAGILWALIASFVRRMA